MQATLPGKDRPLAALYEDDQDDAIYVRMHVSDVGLLHKQRDDLLTRVFEVELSKALVQKERREGLQGKEKETPVVVEVDKSQFVEQYEKSVLALEKLTPDQRRKLAQCKGKRRVHVKAPAGAGKTYIAMYQMLELLKQSDGGAILFVAPKPALCYFVVRWLCARVQSNGKGSELDRLLPRLHVLYDPLPDGPRVCSLKNGRIAMSASQGETSYAMVVVDESHHLYKDQGKRATIEKYATAHQRLILLSDISQSLGKEDEAYPEVDTEVRLTEVVRCSKRIVQAATTFQLGEKKLDTQCAAQRGRRGHARDALAPLPRPDESAHAGNCRERDRPGGLA